MSGPSSSPRALTAVGRAVIVVRCVPTLPAGSPSWMPAFARALRRSATSTPSRTPSPLRSGTIPSGGRRSRARTVATPWRGTSGAPTWRAPFAIPGRGSPKAERRSPSGIRPAGPSCHPSRRSATSASSSTVSVRRPRASWSSSRGSRRPTRAPSLTTTCPCWARIRTIAAEASGWLSWPRTWRASMRTGCRPTSNRRTRRTTTGYERLGFRAVGSFTVPSDGHVITTMWRPAAA